MARALFYVPGLRELVRRQESLAELSADERAIGAGPGSRSALARAMLSFAEHSRPDDPAGVDPERIDHLLGDAQSWRFPIVLCLLALSVLGLLAAVGVLAGQVAAGSATLAPPFLSRQPCIVVLATIPGLLGLVAIGLGRRAAGRTRRMIVAHPSLVPAARGRIRSPRRPTTRGARRRVRDPRRRIRGARRRVRGARRR